jgi:hypothetical protein
MFVESCKWMLVQTVLLRLDSWRWNDHAGSERGHGQLALSYVLTAFFQVAIPVILRR